MSIHTFTRREEFFHAVTHGIGAFLSIAALVLLIVFASIKGGATLIVSVTIFGLTMLLMYVASTIVHSLPISKLKNIFLIIDHAAIYLFIAGTYTPLVLSTLQGVIGWTLFGIVWGIAVIGITLKVFFVHKFVFLSTLAYIMMGWIIVFAWGPLTAAMHQHGILFLVLGGVVYTLGAIFYVWKKIPYHHVIWHIFVIIGSILHFFAIFFYVI